MVNLDQKASVSEEDMNRTPTSEVEVLKKSCADCHATTTPLWRGGPAGPRTLCNACGIRQRKKRRAAILGLDKAAQETIKKKRSNNNTNKLGLPLKMKLMALGRKMVLQRSTWHENQMNQLGEEEQAAILLMALSCGSVYS